MRSKARELHEKLEQEKIPIHGCAEAADGKKYIIDFQTSATDAQKKRAYQIADSVDWDASEPKPMSREEARGRVRKIPPIKKEAVLRAALIELIAERLIIDPEWLDRVTKGHSDKEEMKP